MIVIGYLQKRFKIFVAKRLAAILKLTRAEDWRHVPGKQNPADTASRGLAATDRAGLRRWLTGPEFLAESPGKWPGEEQQLPSLDNDAEVKKDIVLVVNVSEQAHQLLQ